MIDSVIAGTGNSRYLRTSIPAETTWEEALAMLRAGTFPIDLAGINQEGFVTVGTALNSANLLKAAVLTALGLNEDATPSDAWEAILAKIAEKADASDIPAAYTDVPSELDSAGYPGVSKKWARGDHVHPTNIFWADDNTTSAEVEAAYVAGKNIMHISSHRIYTLTDREPYNYGANHRYNFACPIGGSIYLKTLDQDVWSNETQYYIPYRTSELYNDAGFIKSSDAYASNPVALGTASPGSSTKWARGDHVHPTPTASDVGAVASNYGIDNAGKVLVIGSDGAVTAITKDDWLNGNY